MSDESTINHSRDGYGEVVQLGQWLRRRETGRTDFVRDHVTGAAAWHCRRPSVIHTVNRGGMAFRDLERTARCWARTKCVGCAMVLGWQKREMIGGGLRHQVVDEGRPVSLLTVTENRDARSYQESSKRLTLLLRDIKREMGSEVAYCGVPEPQRRGAVHWHVLLSGVRYTGPYRDKKGRTWPGHDKQGQGPALSKRHVKGLFERHGFGTGFIGLRAVCTTSTDEVESAAHYLAKYLDKAEQLRIAPPKSQLVRLSRGKAQWWPGVTMADLRRNRPTDEDIDRLEELVVQAQFGGDEDAVVLARRAVWEAARREIRARQFGWQGVNAVSPQFQDVEPPPAAEALGWS